MQKLARSIGTIRTIPVFSHNHRMFHPKSLFIHASLLNPLLTTGYFQSWAKYLATVVFLSTKHTSTCATSTSSKYTYKD